MALGSVVSLDRSVLRSRVQSELGYSGTLSASETTVWNEKIDMAVNDVVRAFPWAFTRNVETYTCTISQEYVVLNEKLLEVSQIDSIILSGDASAAPVTLTHQEGFARKGDLANQDTGVPSVSALRYDATTSRWRLYLKPVPDAAYTIQVAQRLLKGQMGSDTDTIPLPSELHDLALTASKWRIARHKNRPDSDKLFDRWRQQLGDYKNTVGERGQSGDWRFQEPTR